MSLLSANEIYNFPMTNNKYTQNELDMIEAFLKNKGAKKLDTIDTEKFISNKSINSSLEDNEDPNEDIPEIDFDDSDGEYY